MARFAWIVGGSTGIGRALALRLARDGDRVAVSARRADRLDALAAEARGLPGTIVPLPLDVTDADAVAAAADRLRREHGPIDLAVLAAACFEPMGVDDFALPGMRRHVEVNVMGVVNAVAALLPDWRAEGRGHLVVVASVNGYRGLPTSLAYGPTKAYLINLAEALAVELRGSGIRVQVVNPGFVETPLVAANDFAMPFLVSAEAAAERIRRGIDGGGFEITFPRRFTWLLKLARMLPYALYLPLAARLTRR